jgi:hypothetical protein
MIARFEQPFQTHVVIPAKMRETSNRCRPQPAGQGLLGRPLFVGMTIVS